MSRTDHIVILGAGLSGLTAASCLGDHTTVVEQHQEVGGLCRSKTVAGFTFDRAGHVLHFGETGQADFLLALLGGCVRRLQRNASAYAMGVEVGYPLQAHLAGLPCDVVTGCLEGLAAVGDGRAGRASPANFEEWAIVRFGESMARRFMLPYNRKLWTVALSELSTDWAQRFVPVPTPAQVRAGAEGRQDDVFGYNAAFYYPDAGMGALPKAFLPKVAGLRCGTAAIAVSPQRRLVHLADGTSLAYDVLVSTVPLPSLVNMLEPPPPPPVIAAAGRLRHVSVYCLNLGVRRPHITDRHWIYFFDEDVVFCRVGITSNLSPAVAPPGTTSLCVEVSHSRCRPLDRRTIRDRVIRDLVRVGLLRPDDEILVEYSVDLEHAYAIPDHHREAAVSLLVGYLRDHDIHSVGRFGSWQYMSIADVVSQARRLAAELRGREDHG